MALAGSLVAEDSNPTLKVGNAAPPLAPSRWLQGDPVASFQTGTVYIVEFWATWCGPCRASIPHLNEIHNKLKDKGLVVIGQNVWERKPAEDVVKFIKDMGDKMTYRVAFDGENKMAKSWMEAADQGGVPTAFVVDKAGKIAWIGHPMDGLDQVAADVLAGTFSPEKELRRKEQQQEAMKKLQSTAQKLGSAMATEKWDDALALLSGMQKDAPEEMQMGLTLLKFNILVKKKDGKAAAGVARQVTEGKPDNPELLNMLAWELATAEGLENRDLTLAESLAVRANKASGEKEAGILDTLARITFMKDRKKEAIALQKKAVELAQPKELKDELSATLKSYEEGKLPPATQPQPAGHDEQQ